jgi:hypothetical protein
LSAFHEELADEADRHAGALPNAEVAADHRHAIHVDVAVHVNGAIAFAQRLILDDFDPTVVDFPVQRCRAMQRSPRRWNLWALAFHNSAAAVSVPRLHGWGRFPNPALQFTV